MAKEIPAFLLASSAGIIESSFAPKFLDTVGSLFQGTYHDPLTPALLLATTGILATRGGANIMKSVAIFLGQSREFYDFSDSAKKKFPITGHILLPVNRIRVSQRRY